MSVYDGQEQLRRWYLVGLDEMFDTRLGCLAVNWPEVYREYMAGPAQRGEHHLRIADQFGTVTMEQFQQRYKERGESLAVLQNSLLSNLELYLAEVLRDSINEAIAEPFRGMPVLCINTWPYKDFGEQERADYASLLQFRLSRYFNEPVALQFIFRSPQELDALYCHNTFKGMFMYDYQEWMDAQAPRFRQGVLLPHTTLTIPAIYKIDPTTQADKIVNWSKRGFEPLRALGFVMSRIVPTTIVDVRLFSVFGHLETGINPELLQGQSDTSLNPFNDSPIQRAENGQPPVDPSQQAPAPNDPTMQYIFGKS